MGLVCISRGSYSRGKELAESLAAKLGWDCLGREELVELATDAGIAVGRLEMAVVKRRRFDEALALEKEHYQAFAAKELCERALRGNLVYHGRAGAMLLRGVSHILRIRVVEDLESRLQRVSERLGLSRDKAREYIEQLEDDLHRWIRTFYNVDWDGYSNFDLVVNLEGMSTDAVATALCSYAQLPPFQETPVVTAALQNDLLAARARIALARDQATYKARFSVTALNREVSVAYEPADAGVAGEIERVVRTVDGVDAVRCTMASTNILWLEERFEPGGTSFEDIVHVAQRWGAGVELLKLCGGEEGGPEEHREASVRRMDADLGASPTERGRLGGIEDDVGGEVAGQQARQGDDLREVWGELARLGVAGAAREVEADPRELSRALDRSIPYSLVVVGDVFRSKGSAAKVRLKRELGAQLSEALRVPVVGVQELREQYINRGGELARAVFFGVVVVLIYGAVFTHQKEILALLLPETIFEKMAAVVALLAFVPVVAFLYGKVTKTLLRLVGIE
jgi:cytidylate kinase